MHNDPEESKVVQELADFVNESIPNDKGLKWYEKDQVDLQTYLEDLLKNELPDGSNLVKNNPSLHTKFSKTLQEYEECTFDALNDPEQQKTFPLLHSNDVNPLYKKIAIGALYKLISGACNLAVKIA